MTRLDYIRGTSAEAIVQQAELSKAKIRMISQINTQKKTIKTSFTIGGAILAASVVMLLADRFELFEKLIFIGFVASGAAWIGFGIYTFMQKQKTTERLIDLGAQRTLYTA